MKGTIVNLLDVVSITAKQVDPRLDQFADMPLIAPDHIESESGRILAFESARQQEAISGKYLVEPQDVIYSKIRPYLMKAAIPGQAVLCSADMYPLKCSDRIVPEFLHQLLLSHEFTQFAISCSNRTGIPKINREELAQFRFHLPSVADQRKVARIAKTSGETVELARQLKESQLHRKQGLMQHLLTGHKRLTGFKGSWKPQRLSSFLTRVTRKNVDSCTRALTVSAQRGLVEQGSYFAKQMAAEDNEHYLLIKHGEFAYNRSAAAGYPFGAIKRLDRFDEGIVSTLCLCFGITDTAQTDTDFLTAVFEGGLLNRQLRAIAHEGARSHGLLNVTSTDFFKLRLNMPPPGEQAAIAEVLNAADQALQLQQQKLVALQQQKRALMQQLLAGDHP
ncbi:MAG: restriction endonuclease subunit S [Hydrogenophaga sp.]|nr:restriction endonuclease subunit S [Hydrogenophaga sp.]